VGNFSDILKELFMVFCLLFLAGIFVSVYSRIIIFNWFKAKLFFDHGKKKLDEEDKKNE